MRFLIDAQLPPALARYLADLGHDATHVADHDMVTSSDAVIWDYAINVGAVIVTKDEDFAARKFRSIGGPSIVWLRLPNMKRRDLIGRFDAMIPAIMEALQRGDTLVEAI